MKIDWFRKLILEFSQIDDFNGWLIAKVEFSMNNFFIKDVAPHVVKSNKNYAVINMCRKCFFNVYVFICNVTVYLVKPSDINKVKQNKQIEKYDIGGNLFFKSAYTKEDIESFIYDVGDKNYIHRTNMPIVPGFLMLEELLFRMLEEVKDIGEFLNNGGIHMEIIFYNPLYADETMEIYRNTHIEKDLGKSLDIDLSKESSVNFTAAKCGMAGSIYKAICIHS